MTHAAAQLQSWYAGIGRKAGRVGTLRNHDGCAAWASGGDDGHHHRRHGAGRAAWRLLPEPALAGQAGNGYLDHHEELDRRERADSERDGRAEKAKSLKPSPRRTRRFTKETNTKQRLRDALCPF